MTANRRAIVRGIARQDRLRRDLDALCRRAVPSVGLRHNPRATKARLLPR